MENGLGHHCSSRPCLEGQSQHQPPDDHDLNEPVFRRFARNCDSHIRREMMRVLLEVEAEAQQRKQGG